MYLLNLLSHLNFVRFGTIFCGSDKSKIVHHIANCNRGREVEVESYYRYGGVSEN